MTRVGYFEPDNTMNIYPLLFHYMSLHSFFHKMVIHSLDCHCSFLKLPSHPHHLQLFYFFLTLVILPPCIAFHHQLFVQILTHFQFLKYQQKA